jgi:hypothetical protein
MLAKHKAHRLRSGRAARGGNIADHDTPTSLGIVYLDILFVCKLDISHVCGHGSGPLLNTSCAEFRMSLACGYKAIYKCANAIGVYLISSLPTSPRAQALSFTDP